MQNCPVVYVFCWMLQRWWSIAAASRHCSSARHCRASPRTWTQWRTVCRSGWWLASHPSTSPPWSLSGSVLSVHVFRPVIIDICGAPSHRSLRTCKGLWICAFHHTRTLHAYTHIHTPTQTLSLSHAHTHTRTHACMHARPPAHSLTVISALLIQLCLQACVCVLLRVLAKRCCAVFTIFHFKWEHRALHNNTSTNRHRHTFTSMPAYTHMHTCPPPPPHPPHTHAHIVSMKLGSMLCWQLSCTLKLHFQTTLNQVIIYFCGFPFRNACGFRCFPWQ